MTQGTPKTLESAISNGLGTDDLLTALRVKDFLSQKFSVAFIKATSDDEIARLRQLWNKIIEGSSFVEKS